MGNMNIKDFMHKSTSRYVFVTCISLLFTSPAGAAVISSTFDVDDEGWIGRPGEGSLAYVATGGNPGGYISITDIGGGSPGSGAFAPGKFLGDLSGFDSGLLSVDMASFAGGGTTFPFFGTVEITGAGDSAFFDLTVTAPPSNTWVTYSVSLDAAIWGKTELEWAAILADVTLIAINTDAFDGADTIGVDNFAISSVPVPAAVWLFGSGLIGLIGLSRRKA